MRKTVAVRQPSALKSQLQEETDARFRDWLNHQTELRRLYAEQEDRENHRKEESARKKRKALRKRKWFLTAQCVRFALLAGLIFHAQTADLVQPIFSITAMSVLLALTMLEITYIARLCAVEKRKMKG